MAERQDGGSGSGPIEDAGNAGQHVGDAAGLDSGTGDATPGSIDGIAVGNLGDAAPIKRGRGRPPGSGKSGIKQGGGTTVAQAKASPASVVGIEALLLGIHSIAASLTKVEEIALEKSEANQLAQALAAVNVHYQKAIDPKLVAWMGVVAVAGQVYGPRVLAYRLRVATEKASKPTPTRPVAVAPAPAPAQATRAQMTAISDPDFVSPVQ